VEFYPMGYKVSNKSISTWKLKLTSYFMQKIRFMLPRIDKEFTIDNSSSKELLGLEYRNDLKVSMKDMVYSMIE
jgi:hypothetical protein